MYSPKSKPYIRIRIRIRMHRLRNACPLPKGLSTLELPFLQPTEVCSHEKRKRCSLSNSLGCQHIHSLHIFSSFSLRGLKRRIILMSWHTKRQVSFKLLCFYLAGWTPNNCHISCLKRTENIKIYLKKKTQNTEKALQNYLVIIS